MAFIVNFQWFSIFKKMPFLYSKFCTYGKINMVMLNHLIFTNFNPRVIIFNCAPKPMHLLPRHSPNFSLLVIGRYMNIHM